MNWRRSLAQDAYLPLRLQGDATTDTPIPAAETVEMLSFRVGGLDYCIDVMFVREIRGWTATAPLPFAPDHLLGVINLRGTILLVIDLSVRLGMPPIDKHARMDGIGLLRQLRGAPATKTIGFILVTGRADKDLIETGRDLEMNNFI